MSFNSVIFAFFLILVFILYWIMPHKYRWLLLLTGNFCFTLSLGTGYIVALLTVIIASYSTALAICKTNERRKRLRYLVAGILLCLFFLLISKYRIFLLPAQLISPLSYILPSVGISFYTFSAVGYIIDVYKNKITAEKHLGKYAAFLTFFPLILAGPIERAGNILPQLKAKKVFDYSTATYGLKQMAWGYFKKLVIADTVAVYVDGIYDNLFHYRGLSLIMVSVLFSIQIYCDFSGYSNIAAGTARLFGFHVMDNFKNPYFAGSIKSFWQKWHISLSTWFRDYIYIPLGGNRSAKARSYFNLFTTFLISGAWHGAGWTYLAWGGLHGTAQIVEDSFCKRKTNNLLVRVISTVGVFCFCTAAWVFFRAASINDAIYVFRQAFAGITVPPRWIQTGVSDLISLTDSLPFFVMLALLFLFALLEIIDYRRNLIVWISNKAPIWRWAAYVIFVLVIILFSQKGEAADFIYFQY